MANITRKTGDLDECFQNDTLIQIVMKFGVETTENGPSTIPIIFLPPPPHPPLSLPPGTAGHSARATTRAGRGRAPRALGLRRGAGRGVTSSGLFIWTSYDSRWRGVVFSAFLPTQFIKNSVISRYVDRQKFINID